MKKRYIVFLFFMIFLQSNAQEEIVYTPYWTLDIMLGQSKGVKPFSEGYNMDNVFCKTISVNSIQIGARHIINPRFFERYALTYDNFTSRGQDSFSFKMDQYRASYEIGTSVIALLNLEKKITKFNFFIHTGLHVILRTSGTEFDQSLGGVRNSTYHHIESDGGLSIGFSPQYRFSTNFNLITDLCFIHNYRQNMNWDGLISAKDNNMYGKMYNFSVGLSYIFRKKQKEVNSITKS